MPQIYKTPSYDSSLIKLYESSLEGFGYTKTRETMAQIKSIEDNLENGMDLGKTDPKHHSKHFRYQHTKNSQTVFYDRIGNNFYMVTVGGQGWPWKAILRVIETQINKYIDDVKRRVTAEKK